MGRRTVLATLIGMAGTFVITALVVAQQPATPGQMPSMAQMMQECQTHCQATTAAVDQMMQRMGEAKQSNDPAQMRTALEAAQQPLAEMKEHMTTCMGMMGMMQRMHGGMGGQPKEK
jgi:hypothetical protein